MVALVIAGGVVWLVIATRKPPPPQCEIGSWSLGPVQAQNAATIAAVGVKLGMPDHAVTVALATAMQESKLTNLTGGDRDSAGLFQQRPSQGWGTYEQVTDPVYASTAFYNRLKQHSDWQTMSVTEAAQLVQHSAGPDAYAQWEPEARALAGALTGQTPAQFRCHDLVLTTPPPANLVTVANSELGTAAFTGPHSAAEGWTRATYLVANATRFALDKVTFDGQTWTADSGAWNPTGPADGRLSLHQKTANG